MIHRNFILTHHVRPHYAGMLAFFPSHPLPCGSRRRTNNGKLPSVGCEVSPLGKCSSTVKGNKPATHSRREAVCPSAGAAGPMDGGGGMIRRRPFTRRDGGISHRRTKPCVT